MKKFPLTRLLMGMMTTKKGKTMKEKPEETTEQTKKTTVKFEGITFEFDLVVTGSTIEGTSAHILVRDRSYGAWGSRKKVKMRFSLLEAKDLNKNLPRILARCAELMKEFEEEYGEED